MASLAGAMQRSSATAGGCKPADAGNSTNRDNREQRTRDVSPSALVSTRDRTRDDVSPQVTTTVVDNADLMQELEIAAPSLEIQNKVANFLAATDPPADTNTTRQNEAQADPPAVDPSLIGLINKTRADHAVILTLLHDGQFADHVQGSKTDRIHAQGQGQIRTEIVTTLMNKWSEYCASPFWLQFAEKNYLEPTPIPLPVNTDEIEFAPFMDEEYDITIFSPSHDDPAVVEMNSNLIYDYCMFAFQQLLIFHYDYEGVATAVKFLPSIAKRTGSHFDIKAYRPPPLMEDSGGNHVALISIPLPRYSTSPNPAAAALLSWRNMCLASNCEPLILTTDDSTSDQFTLRSNLEQAGINFAQTVSQIRITIQHSVIVGHGIEWISVPKYTIQMVARASDNGGHYEARHCTKIRLQSTPLQCLSCFDTCVPMHPPLPARLCPKFNVCKLCWSCDCGQPGTPPLAKHLPACPAMLEMGVILSKKTEGTVTSLLPAGFYRPDPPPTPTPGVANSVVGKRARDSNKLSPEALQALASSNFHKRQRHDPSKFSRSKYAAQQSKERKSRLNAALHAHAQGEASAKQTAP